MSRNPLSRSDAMGREDLMMQEGAMGREDLMMQEDTTGHEGSRNRKDAVRPDRSGAQAGADGHTDGRRQGQQQTGKYLFRQIGFFKHGDTDGIHRKCNNENSDTAVRQYERRNQNSQYDVLLSDFFYDGICDGKRCSAVLHYFPENRAQDEHQHP